MSRALAAAAGIAVDRVMGEPPVRPHPVAAFGRVMRSVEGRLYRDSRVRGVAHAATGVALAAGTGMALRRPFIGAWTAQAGRSLERAALDVAAALDRPDLDEARRRLPALVGRDTDQLEEKDVVRAVVESVAENTVDAIVAPALWAAVAGAPGALAYRAVNTLDAMVGHRSDRYLNYGWASARLDDWAAFVPARLTAALVTAVRPRAAGDVWTAVRHHAPLHPSPNAGVSEAAFAAALGLRLGGVNRYGGEVRALPSLGDGRPPERPDIARAVRLSRDVSTALAALLATPALVRRVAGRRSARR